MMLRFTTLETTQWPFLSLRQRRSVLIAIDISKLRNDVLIESKTRRCPLTFQSIHC
jgi:hypothetical protein